MLLETELLTFKAKLPELLQTHSGKFALIRGCDFIDAFDSPENAYSEGVRRFGLEAFLVKRISPQEEFYRNQALTSGLMHARI